MRSNARMIDLAPAPAMLPAGRRVYAVGDIHGCLAELRAMHRLIAADLAARPVAAPLLVHLGDYVDRGPDSAGVVDLLASGGGFSTRLPIVNLRGNHERTMLDALAGQRAAITDWRIFGGDESLRSWGIDPASPPAGWRRAIPPAHLAFLESLGLMHREGGYLFVHAGIRPGVPLEGQTEQDLISIRQPFLYSEADLGVVVVHGHTPKPSPQVRHNRIGIDTGAVYGGSLTCLVLEGGMLGFLQVAAGITGN
jgi:serine/threonine protein phosphatase 1